MITVRKVKLAKKDMFDFEKAEQQAKKDIKKEYGLVLNSLHIKTFLNPESLTINSDIIEF